MSKDSTVAVKRRVQAKMTAIKNEIRPRLDTIEGCRKALADLDRKYGRSDDSITLLAQTGCLIEFTEAMRPLQAAAFVGGDRGLAESNRELDRLFRDMFSL